MKIFFVILFFTSTLQCGKLNEDMINTKMHNYYAHMRRFYLQTSKKEIKLYSLGMCKKLVDEIKITMTNITQDTIDYTDLLETERIEYFESCLKKLKHDAYLLRCRIDILECRLDRVTDFYNELEIGLDQLFNEDDGSFYGE